MPREEAFVTVYSENDQIRTVPLGDFQDFIGRRAAFHDTSRFATEIRSERSQAAECVQHRRHVSSLFDQMKEDGLGAMLLRQRNYIRDSSQRFSAEVGGIENLIQIRILSRLFGDRRAYRQDRTGRLSKESFGVRAEQYPV
jgi:hypothetical protein